MGIERWIYALPLRLRSLFRRPRVEQELNDELQYHLERKTEEFTAQGLGPKQAHAAALRAMDGLTQRKEECRDARGLNLIDDAIRDVRYALRILVKSPGFTVVAVVTLAVAIGANAVVFGVLNQLILRPLNLPHSESLYIVERESSRSPMQSYRDYVDLRDRNRTFEGLASWDMSAAGLDIGENPTRVWPALVSGNYFDVLGVKPSLGRFFHASDEHGPNSAPYVVLSYAFWHARFHDDAGVIGRALRINKYPFTIIGVAARDFAGTMSIFPADFYVPVVNQEQVAGWISLTDRANRTVFMVLGHLKDGVTPAQAVADLNSVGSYLSRTYPKEDGPTSFVLARPGLLGDFLGRPMGAFLTGLMLLTTLILLAACTNLGSLFAARAADRSREVALRLALGSSRGRILRGLFTEAVLISLIGGAAGLAGSVALLRALATWKPLPRVPLHAPVSPDASVYLVAMALALMSGILFGIVPVRQVLRTDPYQIVKSGSAATGRRITFRDILLGIQIAICAVLVTSSLVAVRGLERTLHGNFGFQPRNTLLLQTVLEMAGYRGDALPIMEKRMIETIGRIPGVTAVGLSMAPPMTNPSWVPVNVFTDATADLRPANAAAAVLSYSVSPRYFEAAGTALLAGRDFTWHDDRSRPRVAVVNREFARKVFGSTAAAIGSYYKMLAGERVQVIGVVEDGKYRNTTESPQSVAFSSILQEPGGDFQLVVRYRGEAQQVAPAIESAMRTLDPGLPYDLQTWDEALTFVLLPARIASIALGVLGALGAMLSITGIYGMAAYSVSRRLKELGIRMAVGAHRGQVLGAAIGGAIRLLAFGSVAGLALGLLASRVLASIVYEASPRDPLVLAGAVGAMALLGLAATCIPAQRALSLDPLKLLREE